MSVKLENATWEGGCKSSAGLMLIQDRHRDTQWSPSSNVCAKALLQNLFLDCSVLEDGG